MPTLDWLNRSAAFTTAAQVPYRLLESVSTHGEQGGISQAVSWQEGGGFRFLRLGAPIFDADGCIHPEVRFATLAAFVWQQETGTAFEPAHATPGTPNLGTHSVFDSYERLPDGLQEPISSKTLPLARTGSCPRSAQPHGVLPAVQRHSGRQAPGQRQRADLGRARRTAAAARPHAPPQGAAGGVWRGLPPGRCAPGAGAGHVQAHSV